MGASTHQANEKKKEKESPKKQGQEKPRDAETWINKFNCLVQFFFCSHHLHCLCILFYFLIQSLFFISSLLIQATSTQQCYHHPPSCNDSSDRLHLLLPWPKRCILTCLWAQGKYYYYFFLFFVTNPSHLSSMR